MRKSVPVMVTIGKIAAPGVIAGEPLHCHPGARRRREPGTRIHAEASDKGVAGRDPS